MLIYNAKNTSVIRFVSVLLFITCFYTTARSKPLLAFPQQSNSPLRVFIDCDDCDLQYLRNEIIFVDHVRDPNLAQVHILISVQTTASEGHQYTISFLGRELFNGKDNKLGYTAASTATESEERSGLLDMIKMGLMPYVASTSEASRIKIQYEHGEKEFNRTSIYDPWDFWVFYLDLGGGVRAEESRNAYNIDGSIRANRITEDWRSESEFYYRYEEENFVDDGETIKSTLREWNGKTQQIYSLSRRWSCGIFAELYSTSYRNIDLGTRFAPAIEYNIYPWSQSDYRVLALSYEMGFRSYDYWQETIYDKYHETLGYHAAKIELEFIQPWGTTEVELEGRQFLAKPDMYSIEFQSDLSVRISGGLSLFVEFDLEILHDQIYLPKGDASRDEILLKRRQLATAYEYEGSFGIRFTFGSIYNNIVNRRL